jgi:hypothetical protein
MSISDVLFEAREDILRYLKDDDGVYDRRRSEIAEVILAMDRLRLSNEFDVPPDATPPSLPVDALAHLDALLKERAGGDHVPLESRKRPGRSV